MTQAPMAPLTPSSISQPLTVLDVLQQERHKMEIQLIADVIKPPFSGHSHSFLCMINQGSAYRVSSIYCQLVAATSA